MISRDSTIYKKIKDSSRTPSLSFLQETSSELRTKGEKVGYDVEHLYCDENGTDFEEVHDVCLISSSSEIQENLEACETLRKSEKSLKKIDEVIKKSDFDYSTEGNVISNIGNRQRPIFVDLTADEKNTWKQTILKRFCDVKISTANEKGSKNEKCPSNVLLEPRIIIADSSNKLNRNETGSLVTALQDRGPCLIPVQPNRSLPIRPAPSVPIRFFRKNCSSSLILPKSAILDVVEVESTKSIDTLSIEKLRKKGNINSEMQIASKKSVSSMDYVVPQISNVGSLNVTKRRNNNEMEHEKDSVKENRKKKRSQGTNSSQNKEERVESSIKEFLTNFCGSNATEGIQNLCTDKCVRATSTTKEETGNKLVPPLRLKKVVHAETERYKNSQIIMGSGHESNYRIITDTTSQPSSSLNPNNCNDTLYEKDADFASSNTDSYKLKYRRNRLKQKLRELRSKAVELAKQMANDSNPQQSTRLRQVMNRYEKRIENLSKLHRKLSTALPISKEVIDVNSDNMSPSDNKYRSVNLNSRNADCSPNNNSSSPSPEPPKLSPKSSLDYDSVLPEEVRNSPPILPRVCLTISSSQDSLEEELQLAERKVWPVNEESMKSTFSVDPLQSNSIEKDPPNIEKHAQNTPVGQQNNISVDIESSDLTVNKRDLNDSKKIIQFSEDNCTIRKKKDETDKSSDGFSQSCLVIQESEEIKCLEFSEARPIISSVTSCVDVPTAALENETFQMLPGKQLPPIREHTLQSNCYDPNQEEDSFPKVHEVNRNTQKVTSNSSQSPQFDPTWTVLNQEHLTLRQNYKGEEMPIDSEQRNDGNYSITEQFPTLGNWLAQMSKKQTSITKPKLQTTGNAPFASTESTTSQISRPEISKIIGPNINNHMMNTTPQRSAEKWQYHHQQQQLQHVAASVTLSQPVAAVPPLRPGICSPIPMTQFYPNNYTIDPYNGSTLNYHPAICPYGTYPYHSRLHSDSLPDYHFPMQESLRSIQHMDKRFTSVQDPIIRYPSPTISTLQHPNNLDFDRLRGNSNTNNIGTTTCLPSLFLSPPSLSSSYHSLPRSPLIGYPTNNQVSRNRMIPDVVAAAAAAAVVAAASFDRQRDTLTYNRVDKDTLSTADIANVIDKEASHVPDSTKSIISRDVINQTQDTNFNEENHESTKYQQMQNFLFNQLALVKTTDNFAQTNSVISNDAQTTMTSIVSTTPYRIPLIPSHTQVSKNASGNEPRNCKTPHLGKVNRSPNSLHNFTCSNCGIIGPKFKCLGCEMAFYCDERCQEKHWYVHVQKCPKKMPKLKKVN
ncbi:hypothetical protein WN48_05626 [Eufriesea mexicana]|uniref:MYND-type domain-containing protein n=2 Tax=Eufriesea mexicana TaxID=516756 RepID=A0A310S9A6_9HYME|nr:hypothetical protein WN48_05626 [Eufriesea mexicana]